MKRSQVSAWRAQAPDARDAVTSALLLLSILFSNIVFYNLVGSFAPYGHLGFLFSADLFLLIASYMMLLPAALQAASGGIRSTDVQGSMAGREPPGHPLREDDALRAGKGK